MKQLLIILLFITTRVLGQQLPDIEPNTDSLSKSNSVIYNTFQNKYDFLISYSENSYWWSNRRFFEIVAKKDNDWEYLTYYDRKKKKGGFTKPSITRHIIDRTSVKLILDQLSQINFWTLDSDSLNNNSEQISEDRSITYTISDGVSYDFQIISQDDYREISAYEPEYFLKVLPDNEQRKRFIVGQKVFKTFLKKNGT